MLIMLYRVVVVLCNTYDYLCDMTQIVNAGTNTFFMKNSTQKLIFLPYLICLVLLNIGVYGNGACQYFTLDD